MKYGNMYNKRYHLLSWNSISGKENLKLHADGGQSPHTPIDHKLDNKRELKGISDHFTYP